MGLKKARGGYGEKYPCPDEIGPPNGTFFALTIVDDKNGQWWISRGCSQGNLMRVREGFWTWIWGSIRSIEEWFAGLPDISKSQMESGDRHAGKRTLYVVPLKMVVDTSRPIRRLDVSSRHVDPKEGDEESPLIEFELDAYPMEQPARKGRR